LLGPSSANFVGVRGVDYRTRNGVTLCLGEDRRSGVIPIFGNVEVLRQQGILRTEPDGTLTEPELALVLQYGSTRELLARLDALSR
jgi:hypothetical protein